VERGGGLQQQGFTTKPNANLEHIPIMLTHPQAMLQRRHHPLVLFTHLLEPPGRL